MGFSGKGAASGGLSGAAAGTSIMPGWGTAIGAGAGALLGGLGGGKGGSAPSTPDFMGIANQQTRDNRPNQSTPFGSSTWSQGPDGSWSQNVSLNPSLQAGADRLMGQIGSQGPLGTGDDARRQAIDAAYGQMQSRLDPQWQQRQGSTEAQLANEGLSRGDQGYQTAMGNLGRERTDAYDSAMRGAIREGTAAQQATFAENLAAQMAPYQQLGMLQGNTQMPGFAQSSLLPAAMAGYQGDLQNFGIQQQGKNSQMAGKSAMAPLSIQALNRK